jgi:hypothetical protein
MCQIIHVMKQVANKHLCVIHAGLLLGLLLYPVDAGKMLPRNFGWISKGCKALHQRRHNSSLIIRNIPLIYRPSKLCSMTGDVKRLQVLLITSQSCPKLQFPTSALLVRSAVKFQVRVFGLEWQSFVRHPALTNVWIFFGRQRLRIWPQRVNLCSCTKFVWWRSNRR